MLYHLPVLSRPDFGVFRAPGPGLGNLLFPIARAVIGRQRHGGTLVLPTIRQIKIGTFIRGERDKRTYGDILRRREAGEMRDWVCARLAKADDEGVPAGGEVKVIRYEGMAQQFHDLDGHSDLVRAFLAQRSRLPVPQTRFDVAMHIRLGDFAVSQAGAAHQNTRIPLEWYGDALSLARKRLGKSRLSGVLFTDDDPARLIDELGLEGFTPEPMGNALTSIMALGNADALIGSRSTFSLWGRYFGSGVAIWPSGFDLQKYAPIDESRDVFV